MALGLIVCGVGGRMGGAVVRAAKQTDEVKLTGAIDKPESARLGKDAGEISAAGYLGVAVSDKIEPHLKPNTVIIDFTNPEAALVYLRAAAKKKAPIVIATTGFNSKQLAEIKRLSRRTPILLSANTSLGVNVLIALLGKTAEMLGDDYDVEIVEAHHRFKRCAEREPLWPRPFSGDALNRRWTKSASVGGKASSANDPRRNCAAFRPRR
jgi:4-hydroxy-tetrahydrodipicolinate reductase